MQPISEGSLALLSMQDDAVAEGKLRVVVPCTVREPKHEKLQRSGLEQQVLILPRQFTPTGDLLRKVADHVDGGGQQLVELLDLIGLGEIGIEGGEFAVLGIV